MRKRFYMGMSVIYVLLCTGAWYSVATAPPDGLANLPLVLVSMPTIVVERVLTQLLHGSMDGYLWEPIIVRLGLPNDYLWGNAWWFFPIMLLQAYCLISVGWRSESPKTKKAQTPTMEGDSP